MTKTGLPFFLLFLPFGSPVLRKLRFDRYFSKEFFAMCSPWLCQPTLLALESIIRPQSGIPAPSPYMQPYSSSYMPLQRDAFK
jgi:hypothetical protein